MALLPSPCSPLHCSLTHHCCSITADAAAVKGDATIQKVGGVGPAWQGWQKKKAQAEEGWVPYGREFTEGRFWGAWGGEAGQSK